MILPNEILCLELTEECFLRVSLEWEDLDRSERKGEHSGSEPSVRDVVSLNL